MRTKLSPHDAFVDNIKDAKALMSYARAFKNRRVRRMRRELRSKVGEALNFPAKQREDLDCLESDDLFVVFMPDGGLGRDHFTDLQPLLRQSLVAACAALETYVADKAMEFVGAALQPRKLLKPGELPARMKSIPLTFERWAEIENTPKRRRRGIRSVIEEHIRETSSPAPSKIGMVLSIIRVKKWETKVDNARKVKSGTTGVELKAIADRRDKIAHTLDRRGRGRASINLRDVEEHLTTIEEVVEAIEEVLRDHKV